ncbi:MAG: glycosyl hydrolase [Erysipelothrix sp.]|nr:glycosyl hydrolase [Erysipelothrix sp.]
MKENVKINKSKRLSNTERAKKLVEQMTLEEKVYLMSGNIKVEEMLADMDAGEHYNQYPYEAGGNDRLGIPSLRFVDGPRGAVTGVGQTTAFPVSMARGASFDTDLEYRIGKAIGKEIRASGGNFFGGVCINLPYSPGWGRSQETYGEDSFHLGAFGTALATGVQSEDVVACAKHYAFNSMENARFKVNVIADKRTEREVYLRHFQDFVEAGGAAIMTAYNKYQGEWAGHSHYLMNEVLKGEWDFDGFVITDFIMGMRDTVAGANGGQNVEMNVTLHYGDKLVEAVKNGDVPESVIDDAALRIVRTLMTFEEAYDKNYDEDDLGTDEHIALALEAAEKSLTLLQNDKSNLPLSKDIGKIAVIGKLADKENTGDYGSSRVYPEYVVTPLQGLKNYLGENRVVYNDGSDIESAKKDAQEADAVIFVVGYDARDEGEYTGGGEAAAQEDPENVILAGAKFEESGGDRKESLGLHQNDIDLIKAVGPVNQNSLAVMIGGNMIMIDEWKDSVTSILMSYYSGMEGGTALAKVIFGDVNPSAKIPFVIPKTESDVPQVDWDANEITYDYYHGYAKLDKENIEPSLPYGFGLSYTTFETSEADFSKTENEIVASCVVANTGDCDGDEVVQLYVGFKNSAVDRPVKVLRGFERVTVKAGEKKTVSISCPIERLKWYNPDTNQWELEDMEYEVYIGTSSAIKDLHKGSIRL